MDGNLQPLEHLVVRQLAHEVLRHELILQTIVDEVVGRNALSQQAPHLFYHAFFQTGLQSTGNLLATCLTVDVDTNDERVDGWQGALGSGGMQVILLNLDGADGALTGINIGGVMHHGAILLLQRYQHLSEFGERLTLQTLAQLRILGYGRQLVALEHRLDIEAGTTTEDGRLAPTCDILIGIEEVLLILEEVVLGAWLADVDEVIGDVDD